MLWSEYMIDLLIDCDDDDETNRKLEHNAKQPNAAQRASGVWIIASS